MKIVVAIKQVLDPTGFNVNRRAEKVFVNREEYIINPADRCALEAALQIKDAVEAEVVVLCGGPERANDALRYAWAMGAEHGIHLTDPLFAGADGLVAAKLLAAAIRKLGDVELALTGDRALDTGAGEVGPRLAEALGWPHILAARTVEINNGSVRVIAAAGSANGAQFFAMEAQRPAVVIVANGSNQPRYPHGGRIMSSYREWKPDAWNAADLGLSEADVKPAIEKRGQAFPSERQPGTLLGSADELVSLLKRQRVI